MADGLPVTPGSGATVAADTVGSATPPATGDRIQYVKLDLGTGGASAPISSTVPVSAASLPLPAGAATQTTLASVLSALQAALPAGTNVIGGVHTNATRNAGILHRSAIASADKLALPTIPTMTGATVSGGSLVSATAYGIVVVANNAYGNTTAVQSAGAVAPGGSNNTLYVTIPAVAGATSYDVFIGTSFVTGAPWVARFTISQVTAGGFTANAVGTVTAAGAAPAGSVGIGIVGTGETHLSQPFLYNTAYTNTGTITPINCSGFDRAYVYLALTLTDLRTLPQLIVVPALQNQLDSNYYTGSGITIPFSGAIGGSLFQEFDFELNGATNMMLLIDTLAGQGAAVSVRVELA